MTEYIRAYFSTYRPLCIYIEALGLGVAGGLGQAPKKVRAIFKAVPQEGTYLGTYSISLF